MPFLSYSSQKWDTLVGHFIVLSIIFNPCCPAVPRIAANDRYCPAGTPFSSFIAPLRPSRLNTFLPQRAQKGRHRNWCLGGFSKIGRGFPAKRRWSQRRKDFTWARSFVRPGVAVVEVITVVVLIVNSFVCATQINNG